MRILFSAALIFGLVIVHLHGDAQTLVQKNIGATTPLAWGDYDNDGDIDLLQHDGTALRILKNNLVATTATFVDAGITLASVNPSSVGWIDHNNDGFLDIYYVNAGNLNMWINQSGSSFVNTSVSLSGESISIIADWGDIDDDGDQDFIGGGLIVKNLGNNRFEVSQRLGSISRTEFLDYDHDGDLDFYSRNFLYTNKGNGVFELSQSVVITGANEEYGDLFFFGVDNAGANRFASYYKYNINISQYVYVWDFAICGGSDNNSSIQYLKIADFDNDGQNDVLVRENSTINLYSSSSVTGTGQCNNIIATLAVPVGRTEAADFDKDGDLDVFVAGNVFENQTVTANAAPGVPSNLSSLVEETSATEASVTLSWGIATDDKTPPKALSYNVIVKRGAAVVFTDGIGATGNQALVQRGNSGYKTSLKLHNLPKANYTWTVQAVDAAFKTSALAAEKAFTIENGPDLVTDLPISAQYSAAYDETGDRYLLTYLKNGNVMGLWADGKTVQPTGVEFKINTTSSAVSHTVGYNAVKNEFMVSWLEVNGDTKKIYVKNLLAAGGNLHTEKVVHSLTDTLKVFLGGDKIAVDPSSGKYLVTFFQTRTDLSQPKIKPQGGPPVTYYPYGLLDVYGVRVSATGITATGETTKLLQTKNVPNAFNYISTRNYSIQSAVAFDSKRKMYAITWNFMGERVTTYGTQSSGELTNILHTQNLYLTIVDENLSFKSENKVDDSSEGAGRSHNLLYNPLSDQFMFVWSFWRESANGTGSDDYSFEVYQRIFSLQNDGSSVFKNPSTRVSIPPNIIDYGSGLPSLSWSKARNEYLITWTKGNASGQLGVLGEGDLFYRRVNPFGYFNDSDSKFLLPTPGNETIIRNNSNLGHFLLGWKSGTQNKLSIFHLPKGPIPSVKSVTPDKAAAGAKVIIKATGMGNTPTLTKVYFSNEDKNEAVVDGAFPDPNDSTKLQVTVPTGLGRNKVMVRVKYDGQASTDNILFENVDVTSVTSVVPLVGSPGEVITIKGVNFPTAKQDLTVMFGNTPAQVTDIEDGNSSTEIKVKVPQAAIRGDNQPVGVVIQGILNNYASGTFRIIRKPVISGVGLPGETEHESCKIIQIKGSNFSNNIDDLKVKIGSFDVTTADILSSTDATITMNVPFGVEGENLHVTVTALEDGTAESPETYKFILGSSVKRIQYAGIDLPSSNSAEFKLRNENDERLTLRVYNECSVREIKFWSKGISQPDSEWKSVTLPELENNEVDRLITDANVTADPLGLDAYFEIVDKSDSIRFSDTLKIFSNYVDAGVTAPLPGLTFGGDVSDYNIVSIPSMLSPNKINTVFKSILDNYGYDKTKWRIFHYKNENNTGANADYVEYLDGLDDIDAGKGYWIIVRNEQEILFDLGNTPNSNGGPFEITLNPGWNQIGNPYNFDVSWEDIKKGVAPGDLANLESYKTFEGGSFVTPATIGKFRGGFVRYNGTAPLTLKIPFMQNPGGGRIKGEEQFVNKLDEKEWRIALDLSAGKLNNKISSFGMHPRASDNVDTMDEHKLPAFIQSLDLSFPELLATSIVATADNHTWDFEVTNTTDSKELTLQWDNSSFGENDRELFLHDLAGERLIDMRKENHYTFIYRGRNNFKIHFGDKSHIEKIAKPSDVVLSDAYPNPMHASTRIPFTVTKNNTHVRLAIYSLQGQELQTLVNADLPAGFYEFDWDGKGPSGANVNSSVVIYRLQTSDSGTGVRSYFKKLVIAP